MIKSGLVNQKRGGGFENGFPQQEYPKGRDEFIRPYVANDKTILKKSTFSTPTDYKAFTPSPVQYDDIFARKSTADERLYILKQIQQGFDKVQKGILGRLPAGAVPTPAPAVNTGTIRIPVPTTPIFDGPGLITPTESGTTGTSGPTGTVTDSFTSGAETGTDFPGVEAIDVDGRDDDAMLEENEVAEDVVDGQPQEERPMYEDQTSEVGRVLPQPYNFNPNAMAEQAIRKVVDYLEPAESFNRNANPFAEPPQRVIDETIASNGVGPRSGSRRGSGSSNSFIASDSPRTGTTMKDRIAAAAMARHQRTGGVTPEVPPSQFESMEDLLAKQLREGLESVRSESPTTMKKQIAAAAKARAKRTGGATPKIKKSKPQSDDDFLKAALKKKFRRRNSDSSYEPSE